MTTRQLAEQLRAIAQYHHGTDLHARLDQAEHAWREQSAALVRAADEIERQEARIRELERLCKDCPSQA